MMTMQINQDELEVLAFLHEHAGGCGPGFAIPTERVARELEITRPELRGVASYLSEHHLITSIEKPAAYVTMTTSRPGVSAICLTGDGENYMRALDAAPDVKTKVTVAFLKGLGTATKTMTLAVAGQLLAEYLKHRDG